MTIGWLQATSQSIKHLTFVSQMQFTCTCRDSKESVIYSYYVTGVIMSGKIMSCVLGTALPRLSVNLKIVIKYHIYSCSCRSGTGHEVQARITPPVTTPLKQFLAKVER